MKSSLFVAACVLPFLLWGVCGILPTFDDYTTLQSPQLAPFFFEGLLPRDGYWRPFDYLFGCLLGRYTFLFPALNHVVIILGHTLSTLLVYKLCERLSCNGTSTQIAALFFFFSPATLGATLAVDGLNQTYAQLWGLLALWVYLSQIDCWLKYKKKQALHSGGPSLPFGNKASICAVPIFIVFAALSKENGLAWAVVPPLVAYAFGYIDRRLATRHFLYGLLLAALYIMVRVFLNPNQGADEDYFATSLAGHLADILQLLTFTWLPVDYSSVLYLPARNWPIFLITLALALPFLLLIVLKSLVHLQSKKLPVLLLCYFILASPHLLTVTSIMHNYAPLSIAAIMMAIIVESVQKLRPKLKLLWSLFLLAMLITDFNHYQAARASGQLSRQMAEEVIGSLYPGSLESQPFGHTIQTPRLESPGSEANTQPAPSNVFCISVTRADDIPGYSSFYVRPVNAFAWGLSVRRYTNYQFPANLHDTVLIDPTSRQIEHVADSALLTGADCVWIVTDSSYHVRILGPTNRSQ